MTEIWQRPDIIAWSQIILNSYNKLLGHQLIPRTDDRQAEAKNLYFTSFVVYSHNTDADPLYNYGNEVGLNLWEMDWEQFIITPSRSTTQPLLQKERQTLLEQIATQGYTTGYQGVRVSAKGTKYKINDVTVWNLEDEQGKFCGQAATFSDWQVI